MHYLEFDFPRPVPNSSEEAAHGCELICSKGIARKYADKAREIHAGLDYTPAGDA